MRQCCPPSIFTRFSQGSILESLVIKFFELTKLFNICWNRVLFILYLGSHFQQKLNNFANSDFFFTKLSRIDPCEKRVNILGGQHWRNFLMACSNLVTMAVYVVKQAWCNEIMPTVYLLSNFKTRFFFNFLWHSREYLNFMTAGRGSWKKPAVGGHWLKLQWRRPLPNYSLLLTYYNSLCNAFTKGQLISKANSIVFAWSKNRIKIFFYFSPEDILLPGFEPHWRKYVFFFWNMISYISHR